MNHKINYPQFIDNAPCKDDLFAGKSHTTIAKNICNTIESKNNCKMIGLDGNWGSGKSNLLKIVEKEINKKDKKYHFFLYDAWGHQEDIQRRAVLEDLTEFLIKKENILDKKEWEEKHKKLLSKNKITEVKTVPRASVGVLISVLTVMLLPAFKPMQELLKSRFNSASFIIYFVPLIIFLVGLIYYWVKRGSLKLAFQEVMSFYHKDRKDIAIKEFVSESMPSAREFNKWIGDISKGIKQHKLIIIFDNMDRLPTDKVQELWSSIHTFFSEQTYNNIWVIVPFDRLHIKNAFKNEDIPNNDSNDNNISYGNDFINKTFDVVYRVSPPMLSDWKSYFKKLWKQSMGISIEDENYQNVTQIYDLLTREQSPRKIIAFINEFATIKQVSANSIPDPYIALYIFGKDIIAEKGDSEFYSPSFLGGIDFLYEKDNEFPKYMASLHFQLPPEKVNDVIFVERLKQAFNNKEIDSAKNMCQSSDFVNVLESAIPLVTNIPNTIEVLEELFKENILSSKVKEHSWEAIYRKLQDKQENNLEKYQIILLQHIEHPQKYLKEILQYFVSIESFNPTQYFNDLNKLQKVKNINVFSNLKDTTLPPEPFIEFTKLAKSDIEKYKVSCDKRKLDSYLSQEKGVDNLQIIDNQQIINNLQSIDYLPYLVGNYSFDNFKKYLEKLIPQYHDDIIAIETIYARLKEIEYPVTNNLLEASSLLSLFNSIKQDHSFYHDLICIRMAKFNNFPSSFSSVILNSEDEQIAEKVAEKIQYYTTYGEILLSLPEMENYFLYKTIAKKLTLKNYLKPKLELLSVLKKFEEIINSSDIKENELLDKLSEWEVKEITSVNINMLPVFFFDSIKKMEGNLVNHCKKCLGEFLQNQTKENWIDSIASQDFSYVTLKLINVGIPDTAFEALKDIMLQIVKGELSYSSINEQVMYLLKKADQEKRGLKNIAKTIRDVFVRGDVEITNELFSMFGELLFKYGSLEENKDSLRTILPNTIVVNHTKTLNNQIEKIKLIIDKAGDEAEDFRQFFSTERQNNKNIEQLGINLGILSFRKEETDKRE